MKCSSEYILGDTYARKAFSVSVPPTNPGRAAVERWTRSRIGEPHSGGARDRCEEQSVRATGWSVATGVAVGVVIPGAISDLGSTRGRLTYL